MVNDLITVVIPVYKVEKYIHRCINSVINQTYENLEIILVDDGSPDKCPEICDEYQKKDSRIKVIHQKNQGLSAARNTGIRNASGKYLSFVDSDDYISAEMISELYGRIIDTNSDLAICSVKHFENDCFSENVGNDIISRDTFKKKLLCDDIKSYAWNKLYKAELFDDVIFPEDKLYEDIRIMFLIAEKVSSVVLVDKLLYYYRIRSGSISSVNIGKSANQFQEALQSRTDFYFGTDFYTYALVGQFKCIRTIVSDLASYSKEKEYKDLFKQSKKIYRFCYKELSFFQNVISILYFIFPGRYNKIKATYKRL